MSYILLPDAHRCAKMPVLTATYFENGIWQVDVPPGSLPITHCPWCGDALPTQKNMTTKRYNPTKATLAWTDKEGKRHKITGLAVPTNGDCHICLAQLSNHADTLEDAAMDCPVHSKQ